MGSALGRLLNILVPQFPHQENADVAVVRTKLISVHVCRPAGEPQPQEAAEPFTRWLA